MDITLALFITLAVEMLIMTVFFFKDIKVLISLSLANIILNVGMNLLIGLMPNEIAYYLFLSLFEVNTFVAEALILIFFCKKSPLKSFLVSLLANALSLGVGLLINACHIDIKTKMILIITFAVVYAIEVAFNVSYYVLDRTSN